MKKSGIYAEPWSAQTRFTRVDYRDVTQVAAMALLEDDLLYGTFELCAQGIHDRYDLVALMSKVLARKINVGTTDLSKVTPGEAQADPAAQPSPLQKL